MSQKIICCPFSVWFHITFTCCCFTLFPPLHVFFQFGFSVFMFCNCIASHCDVMSLSCLCAFVTLNKRLLTYLLEFKSNSNFKTEVQKFELCLTSLLVALYKWWMYCCCVFGRTCGCCLQVVRGQSRRFKNRISAQKHATWDAALNHFVL